jgi:hypothetical protein
MGSEGKAGFWDDLQGLLQDEFAQEAGKCLIYPFL